ncbi:hypothetical protein WICPIJ_009517 [Wickerhamomyces pijperi]|uniref:Uncharacterized protein n=1 Tax=Wickerhamomyces pijperi TaxID=599730 RepID=A0A9P8PNC3_WICPI|nr:hypothetical protein WICPIJ_009517 [Wickerhamomyces pijperi]
MSRENGVDQFQPNSRANGSNVFSKPPNCPMLISSSEKIQDEPLDGHIVEPLHVVNDNIADHIQRDGLREHINDQDPRRDNERSTLTGVQLTTFG